MLVPMRFLPMLPCHARGERERLPLSLPLSINARPSPALFRARVSPTVLPSRLASCPPVGTYTSRLRYVR